jgi:thiol-disulfide isomerase/thioredoxin
VSRLPRPVRAAAGARMRPVTAGTIIASTVLARTGRMLAWPAMIAAAALATGCAGGDIGANTPVSNGQSFVGSSYQSTVFPVGSRPAAPVVAGTTVTGSRLSLAAYRGDVVVLNFWASWCAPCRGEAPALGALSERLKASGVRFVGLDIQDEPDSALAFMTDFRISYPSISDPSDDLALQFRATDPPAAIPSTIIIDRAGRIAARIIGPVTYRSLKALLTPIIAEHA